MHVHRWPRVLRTSAVFAMLLAPLFGGAAVAAQPGIVSGQAPRRQQETAYARGYADGYRRGLADGRRGDRYDPAESREYRGGEDGYTDSYGSRDAYRTNYRAGFRRGYEDGYRDGTR